MSGQAEHFVRLTSDEVEWVEWEADRRIRNNAGKPWNNNAPDDGTGNRPWQINGVAAEIGLAHHLNLFPSACAGRGLRDVGWRYEVRAVQRPTDCLLLQPKDPDLTIFVLARVTMPIVHFLGWILAIDGKVPGNWQEWVPKRPAFWVRQSQLRPLEDLELIRDTERAAALSENHERLREIRTRHQ